MKKRRFNVLFVAVGVAIIVVPWKWSRDNRGRQTQGLLSGGMPGSNDASDAGALRYVVRRFADETSINSQVRWFVMSWHPIVAHRSGPGYWVRYDRKNRLLSVSAETRIDYRNMTDACLREWATQPDFSPSYAKGACVQVQKEQVSWFKRTFSF